MPINVDEFNEKGQEPTRKVGSSVRPDVEEYLQENAGTAFTTAEVAEAVGHNKSTVNQVLRKMNKEGLTDRKQVDNVIYNTYVGEADTKKK